MTDSHQKHVDEATGVETTGHEWDGIRELNNPLPRWWLYIFYASIAWSIFYWVLMPAWPGLPGADGNTPGINHHSDRANVAKAVGDLREARHAQASRLMGASLDEIVKDHDLLQFALASGESIFGDNCATCHGAGGRGAIGYPTLADDVWLWGGTLDDIRTTITHGIRTSDPESRFSEMPAFGRDGFLTEQQIDDVTAYVVDLSMNEDDKAAVGRGAVIFNEQCVSCHGETARGDQALGAPDLTDSDWLYGGSPSAIRETIYNARNSSMPAWNTRLDEPTIKALAIYVHSMGGGQ